MSFDGSLIITMDIDNHATGAVFLLMTGKYIDTGTWSASLTLQVLIDNIEWEDRGLF